MFFGTKKRAENGTRTRDPNLGKVVLYQLSYFRIHPHFISFVRSISLNAVQRYGFFPNLQTFRHFFFKKMRFFFNSSDFYSLQR